MEGLTKKYDTSPESWVLVAVPEVGFLMIASVPCRLIPLATGITLLAPLFKSLFLISVT